MIRTADTFVVVLAALAAVILALRWMVIPPAVPLWYSLPWGEEQLAHPAWLFLLPISGLLWHGITVICAATLTQNTLVFAKVLFLSSFLTNFLLFITLINIIFLVT